MSQLFRLVSHDSGESSWQHEESKKGLCQQGFSENQHSLMWSYFGHLSTHHLQRHRQGTQFSAPQLTARPEPSKHSWRKEGSSSWKRWTQKFSTRSNFHIIRSNLHGGGTEGQELSPGRAHGEHLEARLSTLGQSAACTCGVSHVEFQACLIFWAWRILLSQNAKWDAIAYFT